MAFSVWLLVYHLVAQAAGEVLRNDPNVIACPSYGIMKNATISSPLFPEYHPNFYCEYHIQAPPDRYIHIKFMEFDFPNRQSPRRAINYEKILPQCQGDFLEISDDYNYENKFRYCGKELRKKEFITPRRSVKLILQTKTRSSTLKGFKASVVLPLKTIEGANDVSCKPAPNADYVRCTAPLKRVMTPESAIHLTVNKSGSEQCSKEVILTMELLKNKGKNKNEIVNLDLLCAKKSKYPTLHQLSDSKNLVYDVSVKEQEHFEIVLKKFSTKQIRMCGGHVTVGQNEVHTLKYKARKSQHKQGCLWVIHADNFTDHRIEVEIKTFSYKNDNPNCDKHHLSIMYIGGNMFEMYQEEIKIDPDKFRRKCSSGPKTLYKRSNKNIFGSLNLMIFLSHSQDFQEFEAVVTVNP